MARKWCLKRGFQMRADVPELTERFVFWGRRTQAGLSGALDGAEEQVFGGVLQGDEL